MSAQGVTGATPAQDVVAVADGEVQPSIREAAFDRHRGVAGLLLAPPLFVAVWWLAQDLDPPAQRMAAVLASVMLLWMTEAIPLAMTALLGPALAVILQVAPARQAFAPFADPLVFLVLGGFILALFQQFGTLLWGAEVSTAISFSIVVVILVFRPRGLFGSPVVERV